MKTLEQERMAKAYECVEEAKAIFPKDKKKLTAYKSLVQRLPSMITFNGLLTTLAFMRAKEKNGDQAHALALKHLCEYLSYRFGLQGWTYERLINLLKSGCVELEGYLYMFKEAVEFAVWLKRIVEGEIEDEGTD